MLKKYQKNKETEWVIGGKNIDEDPHFSLFYLKPTAFDSTKECDYKEVYAYYQGFNETYFVKRKIANEISRRLLARTIQDPDYLEDINNEIKKACDQIKEWVYKNFEFVTNSQKYSLRKVHKLYRRHNQLTENLYKYSRMPQALDRGTNFFLITYLNI